MSSKNPVACAELQEFLFREKSLVCKQGVESEAAMAFTQNASVAVRPEGILRIHPEHVIIENPKDLDHGESRTDMAPLAGAESTHDDPAQLLGALVERDRLRCGMGIHGDRER